MPERPQEDTTVSGPSPLADESVELSKAIQRRTGRTFHVATRFLPERVRRPTFVLYAFFRMADEVVDDPDPGPADRQRATLERYREAALGERETDDPVLSAVADLRVAHDIPDREIDVFVDAMERDIDGPDVETTADLAAYTRGSAVAVGNMMLAVMDPPNCEAARPHARALAEAFQLTNMLRDVREDVTEYGRVYLPRDAMDRHGVSRADLANGECTSGVRALVGEQLRATESRYREGVAGIAHLPADTRFPVLLSAVLYAEYHRLIRERDYDVLSDPPSLSVLDYCRLFARTWYHWRRGRDPETVFYRVSAIEATPPDRSRPAGEGPDRAAGEVGLAGRLKRTLSGPLAWLAARLPGGVPCRGER